MRRGSQPAFRTTTTGTTGKPTSVYFTAREIQATGLLGAITFLQNGHIRPEDIVQISTSSRATLGNTCFSQACQRIGAVWYQTGLVDPAHALALLAEEHHLPGKKLRASFLNTYASYLGELVECGLRSGYQPRDFGLERISVGGEIVTEGLKRRCQKLFDCFGTQHLRNPIPQGRRTEQFDSPRRGALLDAQNGLLRDRVVSEGTLSASLVHPREVFKPAILESAASVILLHNHPSGDPEPSREDIRLTRQLVECARMLDLRINDHVIIGQGRFVSLAERGVI